MILLTTIWAKIWPYIAIVGTVLAGLFAVRQSGKSAGKAELQSKINQEQASARKESRNVEDTNAALSDADVDRRLDKWVRNK